MTGAAREQIHSCTSAMHHHTRPAGNLNQLSAVLLLLLIASACREAPEYSSRLPPGVACDPSVPVGENAGAGFSFDPGRELCVGLKMDDNEFVRMARESRLDRAAREASMEFVGAVVLALILLGFFRLRNRNRDP